MNMRKRAIEGVTLAGLLVMMCTIADAADMLAVEAIAAPVEAVAAPAEAKTDFVTNGTAGVVTRLDEFKTEALDSIEAMAVNVQQSETRLVAAAEEAVEEELLSEEELAWQNRLMAEVEEFLYVRAAGDENAEIVGKLYKGAVAEIVEPGDTWTHIVSGNVDGYVSNEYCIFGLDAMNYAMENFDTMAAVQTNGLRVRSGANPDSSVITAVSTGTTLTVDADAESTDEWIAVEYAGTTGYVSAEYVTTELALGEGITIEEEQAELAKKAEEEAARKAAQVASPGTVQNSAVAASTDDVTLLAALIQCEAGNQPYEGQLAVGAVVMNRLRSGRYGGSIYDVIYAPGQFPPAGKGMVANNIANGPKASCIQAAAEAINGADNTGGATRFRRASSGQPGVVIGAHVFY